MDRDQWLAQVRGQILDPALPVRHPHHSRRHRPGSRDLLDEPLVHAGGGDGMARTVFAEGLSSALFHDPAARVDRWPGPGGPSCA